MSAPCQKPFELSQISKLFQKEDEILIWDDQRSWKLCHPWCDAKQSLISKEEKKKCLLWNSYFFQKVSKNFSPCLCILTKLNLFSAKNVRMFYALARKKACNAVKVPFCYEEKKFGIICSYTTCKGKKNLESIGRRQELLPRSLEEGRKTTRAAAFALAEATPSIDPKMKATKNKRVELSKNIDRYHFFSNLFFHFFISLQSWHLLFHWRTHGVPANDVHASSLLQLPTPRGAHWFVKSIRVELASLDFCPVQGKKELWMKFILTWFACFPREVKLRFLNSWRKIFPFIIHDRLVKCWSWMH